MLFKIMTEWEFQTIINKLDNLEKKIELYC